MLYFNVLVQREPLDDDDDDGVIALVFCIEYKCESNRNIDPNHDCSHKFYIYSCVCFYYEKTRRKFPK